MVAGIEFHRGTRKLELGKTVINEAVQFPDDFEFYNCKEEKRFFKNYVDDVTRFGEKVEKTTQRIYDSATTEITNWVVDSDPKDTILSVFTPPTEPLRVVRTALVQCNFTDISRLITDFRYKLMEVCEEREDCEVGDMVITEADTLHGVVDRITAVKQKSRPSSSSSTPDSSLLVLIIRQFESLRPSFLDSLIALIYSNTVARSMIGRLRLVVCLSTSAAFFNQTCSTETLNLMRIQQFQFTKLDEIFQTIISTGIHSHFKPPRPKPKSIEDDDPSLLDSDDCAPAVFSGQFLAYLRTRFFSCDYSIAALIRAVQFALLRQYLKDPLWRQEKNDEQLRKYDVVLEAFCKEFWLGSATNLHIEVQSDKDFWTKIREKPDFKERKQFLFDSNSRRNHLQEFAKRLREDILKIDEEWCRKLDELMDDLEVAVAAPEVVTLPPPPTPKTPGKMSFAELQKQQKAALSFKQQNPVRVAKQAVFGHVMTIFESTLRPYPATWRNVIDGHTWTAAPAHVKTALDAADEADIEKCLLGDPANAQLPISVAWRALLCHRNFKSVQMSDWAADFVSKQSVAMMKTKKHRETAKGAFFAAAGQLESIGLIRGAADRRATTVHVQYHPIHFIPDF